MDSTAMSSAPMEVRVDDDPAIAAADLIAARLGSAVRRRGGASLALSGGSTAPPMIDRLTTSDLDWTAVTVYQVDERVAPDGHPARNAGQLDGLRALATVHLLPVTSARPREAAAAYASLLPPNLDVVHLGLGTDGHTASWPPNRDRVRDAPTDVELVDEFNGWERMTITLRVVNRSRCRVVLASGADKRSIVERWLAGDTSIPVSAVERSATWVFLDPAAAPAR